MATISRVLQRDFQSLWLKVFSETVREGIQNLGDEGKVDIFKWTKRSVRVCVCKVRSC